MAFARSGKNSVSRSTSNGPTTSRSKTLTSYQYRTNKMPQTFKLSYFDFTGRGELSRLLFAVAYRKFEDHRIKFSDWPALKATGQAPFGTLPFLTVTNADGTSFQIAESMCIARYLAAKFNLAGSTEQEKAEVEMYCEILNSLFVQLASVQAADEADKARLAEQFLAEPFVKCMTYLEEKLARTSTGYLVGNSLTVADLYATVILDLIISSNVMENLFEGFARVRSHRLRVRAVAAVKNWNTSHNQ